MESLTNTWDCEVFDFKLTSSDVQNYCRSIGVTSLHTYNSDASRCDSGLGLSNPWTKSRSKFTILNKRADPSTLIKRNNFMLPDVLKNCEVRTFNQLHSRDNTGVMRHTAVNATRKIRCDAPVNMIEIVENSFPSPESIEAEKYKDSLVYQLLIKDEEKIRREDFFQQIPLATTMPPASSLPYFKSRELMKPASEPISPELSIGELYEDISSQYTFTPEYIVPEVNPEYAMSPDDQIAMSPDEQVTMYPDNQIAMSPANQITMSPKNQITMYATNPTTMYPENPNTMYQGSQRTISAENQDLWRSATDDSLSRDCYNIVHRLFEAKRTQSIYYQ